MKFLQPWGVFMNPLRALPLGLADQCREVDRPTETYQEMNMVGDAADDDGLAFSSLADPGQIGMSLLPKGVVAQVGLAISRGEDDVDVNLCERLRHSPAFGKR